MSRKHRPDHRTDKLTETLEGIARQHLGLIDLKTRKNDSADFFDLPVWAIEAALAAAFEAGRQSAEQIA